VVQDGAPGLGSVALAPRTRIQAVEDLEAETLQRPQPDRADEVLVTSLVNQPQAISGSAEVPDAFLDGLGDLRRGQRRTVEQEPAYRGRGPEGQ
jgi:hypothetical protein